MAEDRIKIRLESYDHEALDMSAEAKVIGPVPLPTRIERYTVLRSPHGDKKSREQFEVRTHKRIIYLSQPTKRTVDLLSQLNLPAGVEIKIRA